MNFLCYYFIIDYEIKTFSFFDQVRMAIDSGATTVQYRNKNFKLYQYKELLKIRSFCFANNVMFVVNDDVLLGKAVEADGVHLGQGDTKISWARKILGEHVILGLSISNLNEFYNSDFSGCDYIGVGPVFNTETKFDSTSAHGIGMLKDIVKRSFLPVVAIGGMNPIRAKMCINLGAKGIAFISYITRKTNPVKFLDKLTFLESCI